MIAILRIISLALLLGGCSAALLEDVVDVGEFAAPRLCNQQTKVFNTFTMRAPKIVWKGDEKDPNATLTIELVFHNDKNFPIALSNSGNGVLYAVEFRLQGAKGGSFAPKEASGIVLMREPKKFKEPPRRSVFAGAERLPKRSNPVDNARDLNFRINPGEPESGKLVFQVPRGNYLLTIERKLTDKRISGQATDHLAACKISSSDMAAAAPVRAPGIQGIY